MIDAKFIEEIAKNAVKAAGPVSFKPDAEPGHVYLLRQQDGNYRRITAERHPNRYHASSLETLAGLAGEQIDDGVRPELWYGRTEINLVMDPDSESPNMALLPVGFSPQFRMLESWEKSLTTHSQNALIRLLRVVFPDSVMGADLEDLIRRVKVTVSTNSDQQRAKTSLGKSVEAQLGDTNGLPDYVRIQIPVFADATLFGALATVSCAFDFYPEEKLFSITPIAGSMERAAMEGEDYLASRLTDLMDARGHKDCGVTYGLYRGRHG